MGVRLARCVASSGPIRGENVAEGAEKSTLRGPVADREHHVRERPSKRALQSLPKIPGGAERVVPEGATAPGAENQRRMAERPRDREQPVNPPLQQVPGLGLANGRSVGRGTADEAEEPRLLKRDSVIGPKDRNSRRIDYPIGGIRTGAPAMGLVHRVADQGVIQRAGPTENFLLGARASEKAAPGLNAVREVESEGPQARFDQPSGGLEGRLVCDPDIGRGERVMFVARQRGVGLDALLAGVCRADEGSPVDLLVVGGRVMPGPHRFYRGTPERGRDITGDVQLVAALRGHLLGIQARQQRESAG